MYMSPEQASASRLDARSDIYALGMTLYFLLTGKAPFDSRDPFEIIALQCKEDPPSIRGQVPTLSRWQARVFERMIAKQPEDRYPDYESLIADLRAARPRVYELADARLRLRALLIDGLLATFPGTAIAAILTGLGVIDDGSRIATGTILAVLNILGIWWYGQTPGKWFSGIQVIRENELPFTFWQSVLRYVAYPSILLAQLAVIGNLKPLVTLVIALVWAASLLMVGLSKKKQALHDHAVGSVVVKMPVELKIATKKQLQTRTQAIYGEPDSQTSSTTSES